MTTGEKENDRPEAEADEGSIPESPASEIPQEAENSLEDALASEPDELETLRAENESLRDEFLRAKAEAENARKRAQTEITNARRFAVEGFAGELLNVRDSLDLARAVDLNEGDSVVERVVEGLELTLRQLDSVFERFSVYEISPEVGDKLDPDAHQAMSLIETAEVPANHIFQVVQKGYRLNERLLRPARVLVAKAPTEDPPAGAESS
ncbi:MAG: nucleotide exchange factor GrpE [Gammaproteobacteria bacterium]